MKSYEIVGYTYQAEVFTPHDLIEYMIAEGSLSPAARDIDAETNLTNLASAYADIDRYNELSYDSDDFPKVIFADQVESREETKYLLGYTDQELDDAGIWDDDNDEGE